MPRRTERQRESENLMKTFVQFCKIRAQHLVQRARRQEKFERRTGLNRRSSPSLQNLHNPDSLFDEQGRLTIPVSLHSPSLSLSSNSDTPLQSPHGTSSESASHTSLSFSSLSSSSSSTSSSSNFGDISSASFGSEFALDGVQAELADVPPLAQHAETSSKESSEESSTTSNIGFEQILSDQDISMDSDTGGFRSSHSRPQLTTRLGRLVRNQVAKMYKNRYEVPRKPFPRGPGQLRHTLDVLKHERPDHFRQELRVWPQTFDRLIERLEDDPVFFNNSSNQQMPVEDQVAITLYRLGHFGNAAGLDKVAKWAGYSKGTVSLATRRVLTSILRREFMDEVVSLPTEAEREQAKQWIEGHSCKAWRDGWLMVDGTLIPLYDRPFWYGESYFDRKCNYSLNIQVISLPNLRIIDYGYGYTGSTHDSTAWEKTRIYAEHDDILEENDFVWGDSAYPLEIWVIAPYKKPESEQQDNTTYNNYVSMLRIRSEHAIGFLKGRFQSLKGLRINITNEASHKFATYWVVACIGVHSFAMKCEAEEREAAGGDDDGADKDPFVLEGLSSSSEDSDFNFSAAPRPTGGRSAHLAAGKARREQLKRRLLRHLVRKHNRQ